MTARSCTEVGAAMIALRVAELRKEAVATKAAASIEMETSTARFVLRNLHPDAVKAVREFASQVVDAEDGGAMGTLLDPDGGHGMTSDRERYDIDWSSLTPAEAALVDEFAAALRQAREEDTEKLLLALYKFERLAVERLSQ